MDPLHWYPGHMAKTEKWIKANYKLFNTLIIIVDARAPQSSLEHLVKLPPKKWTILVLTKIDLADPVQVAQWQKYYRGQGYTVVSLNQKQPQKVLPLIEPHLAQPETMVYGLILGLPNAGKSTFINALRFKKAAATGAKPGVTTSRQWIKITPKIMLLDIPGMLPPKIKRQTDAWKLSIIGAVPLKPRQLTMVLAPAVNFILQHYPTRLSNYFKIPPFKTEQLGAPEIMLPSVLTAIAKKRGYLITQEHYDLERAGLTLHHDLFTGKITGINWDQISHHEPKP